LCHKKYAKWHRIYKKINTKILDFSKSYQTGWVLKKKPRFYFILLKITKILEKAKQSQVGSVTKNVTNVTFDFTEGWFRKN
jgi:hypothetical protein